MRKINYNSISSLKTNDECSTKTCNNITVVMKHLIYNIENISNFHTIFYINKNGVSVCVSVCYV